VDWFGHSASIRSVGKNSMHDMIWAVAFERVLFLKLADGLNEMQARQVATEYANRAVRAYGNALMSNEPVRR
jgi:hypothetical protein